MPQDVQSYRAVYKEWCREFQEYKYKMEEWSRQKTNNVDFYFCKYFIRYLFKFTLIYRLNA